MMKTEETDKQEKALSDTSTNLFWNLIMFFSKLCFTTRNKEIFWAEVKIH